MLILTPKHGFDSLFLSYYVSNCKKKEIARKACGISIIHSHKNEIEKLLVNYPSLNEQKDISTLFSLVSKKERIIMSKIEALKKYKEGLMKYLSASSKKLDSLFEMVTICKKTGLQSSEGLSKGKYKFFVNATNDETKWTNDYLFDGEYLILNTGGQAYTNYINGKFSAMSDCLVIKPKRNAISIYYWLKANENRINKIGFQGTGLRHLDPDWLMRQKVNVINFDEKRLSIMNESLDRLILLNNQCLFKLKVLKNGLLNSMFI